MSIKQEGAVLTFTSTKINSSVNGQLKKDKDGYYNGVIIGAFDVFNENDEWYPMAPVKRLFDGSAQFCAQLEKGYLKGEYGHPVLLGLSEQEQFQRIAMVLEERVSHHFRPGSVKLSQEKDADGRMIWLTRADIKCMGPNGQIFDDSLQNPHENMGLSIRGITLDHWRGMTLERSFEEIFTWDAVNQPGKKQANKVDTNLFNRRIGMQSVNSVSIPIDRLVGSRDVLTPTGVCMQNAGIDVDRILANIASSPALKRDSRTW